MTERIFFTTATVYARKIKVSPKLFTYGVHRISLAKLDTGYIIIEMPWYGKPW